MPETLSWTAFCAIATPVPGIPVNRSYKRGMDLMLFITIRKFRVGAHATFELSMRTGDTQNQKQSFKT